MKIIAQILRNIRFGLSSRVDDRKDFRAVNEELWKLVEAFKCRHQEMEALASRYAEQLEECQRGRTKCHEAYHHLLLKLQNGGAT